MNAYPFTAIPQYQNPVIPNVQPTTNYQPQAIPKQEFAKVNGREGALAFPLGPDSSALALDLNDPILWVIVSDSAGYKTVTPWDLSNHREDPPVKESDLNSQLEKLTSRIDDLEERMNRAYGKPGNKQSWSNNGKPNGGNGGSSGNDQGGTRPD